MPAKEIIHHGEVKMKKALEALVNEFHTVRTGRANTALLDSLRVDYYGTPTPLKQMASLTIPEARVIVIQPWDAGQISNIEKAIQESGLGITPQNDGKHVRLTMPQPTAERRQELEKVVRHMSEQSRVSLRNIRREAKEALEKEEDEGRLSEDEGRRAQEELQKVTDRYAKDIDRLLSDKEKEIHTV
ncbi:MAG: ribosome recycling factor [Candidatus Omnitrophica bacterium]|nr:ribosome recycling factor [Candidatus Omnitrophota bacterium]